jgi:hypothetical protein
MGWADLHRRAANRLTRPGATRTHPVGRRLKQRISRLVLSRHSPEWTGWDSNPRQPGDPRLPRSPRGQAVVTARRRTCGASSVLFMACTASALRPSAPLPITTTELCPVFSQTELPAQSIPSVSTPTHPSLLGFNITPLTQIGMGGQGGDHCKPNTACTQSF